MTPPLSDETPVLMYTAPEGATAVLFTRLIEADKARVADYQQRYRDWEEEERLRRRAIAEAARAAAEEMERQRMQAVEAERMSAKHADELRRREEARRRKMGLAGLPLDDPYGMDAKRNKKKRAFYEDDEYGDYGMPGKKPRPGMPGYGMPVPGMDTPEKPNKKGKNDRRRQQQKDQRGMRPQMRPGVGGVVPWTMTEDQLLLAIVHEFGSNWALVSDVLSASTPFKGTFRRSDLCQHRFQQLNSEEALATEGNPLSALQQVKGSARLLLTRAMPVEDEVLRLHLDRLVHIAARQKKRVLAEKDKSPGDDLSKRVQQHSSWQTVRSLLGPSPNPQDIIDQSTNTPASGAPGGGMVLPTPAGVLPPGLAAGLSLPGTPVGTPSILPSPAQGVDPAAAAGVSPAVAMAAAVQGRTGGTPPMPGPAAQPSRPLTDSQQAQLLARLQQSQAAAGGLQAPLTSQAQAQQILLQQQMQAQQQQVAAAAQAQQQATEAAAAQAQPGKGGSASSSKRASGRKAAQKGGD